jgi:hydroxypyruvate isomerase
MSIHFSICIEMMFPELPIETRIEKAAAAGFEGIEFWDWRNKDLDALVSQCGELGLAVTNMSGQRAGSLIDPAEFELYKGEIILSIEAAKKIQCKNLMLLTNPLDSEGRVLNSYPDISPHEKRTNCVEALSQLASLAGENGPLLLMEPLNTAVDHAGYWLDDADRAFEIIREVGHPRVSLLYDCYHMQAMGRDVNKDVENNLDIIGYFHAADFPGRHEPGTGKMNYSSTLRLLDKLGYDGCFGFEFSPAGSSEEALESIYNLIEK